MGRPLDMQNLHAPTVPSGPTSATTSGNLQTAGLSFQQLQTKKDNLEAEIRALSSVLDSHHVDMNTSLLTPDGFPRADIDVAQIRTTRSRIIHLKNDYKQLMAVIEKRIHEHFAKQADNAEDASMTNGHATNTELASRPAPVTLSTPFAKVNSVVTGSPADEATLKAGDLIRSFGYVNHTNHDGLKRVGECVQGNEGRDVIVKVSRPVPGSSERYELRLNLRPRRDWGGRGLLGCHILPL